MLAIINCSYMQENRNRGLTIIVSTTLFLWCCVDRSILRYHVTNKSLSEIVSATLFLWCCIARSIFRFSSCDRLAYAAIWRRFSHILQKIFVCHLHNNMKGVSTDEGEQWKKTIRQVENIMALKILSTVPNKRQLYRNFLLKIDMLFALDWCHEVMTEYDHTVTLANQVSLSQCVDVKSIADYTTMWRTRVNKDNSSGRQDYAVQDPLNSAGLIEKTPL